MKKRILCIVLAALALAAALAGCSSDEKEQMVLFTWEGMFPQEVLDAFEEEFGVEIIYSNFDTNETMLEKLSQAGGGDYDVVIADDYIIEQVIAEGLAAQLDRGAVTSFGNIDPLYLGQLYDPDDKYTVPYGAGIPLIVYDPERVDFEITGYNDLWDPRLEDSVAIIGSYRVINGITLLSMGRSMNEEDPEVIADAAQKLLELAPNIRTIQDSNTQNSLLSGEASVAFMYTSQVTAALAENPELKVVFPEEGLGFGIMAAFVPSQAPNSEAGFEFLNYLLRPEVAKQCIEYTGYYNINQAANDIVDPSLVVPAGVPRGETILTVSAEADEAYNKSWIEFRAACE